MTASLLFFLCSCLFNATGASIQQRYMIHSASHSPSLIVFGIFPGTNLDTTHYEHRRRHACKTLTCSLVHDHLCYRPPFLVEKTGRQGAIRRPCVFSFVLWLFVYLTSTIQRYTIQCYHTPISPSASREYRPATLSPQTPS